MLDFLVEERAISQELRSRMLGWRYSGFSVHNRAARHLGYAPTHTLASGLREALSWYVKRFSATAALQG